MPEGTPEKAAALFARAWLERDYGTMGELCDRVSVSGEQKPDDLPRRLHGSDELTGFKVMSVHDEAPAVSVVRTRLRRTLGDSMVVAVTLAPLRVIYQDDSGSALPRNVPGGEWRVLPGTALWNEKRDMDASHAALTDIERIT